MRKIVIIVKNLTSGGAEKQSILLAKALSSDYKVHYVIFNAEYQEPKYLTLLQETDTINIVALDGQFFIRFFQFIRYLKNNKIDYVFSYLTAANFIGSIASRVAGVKFVYTGIRNAYLPLFKRIMDRVVCNRLASKAILNCYSGEEYFLEKGFKRNKIVVIPNCFENITPFKEKIKVGSRIEIISVGRFVEQKDYYTALSVIRTIKERYPNIRYTIVGYGELEASIRRRISEMKLGDYVEIYINPNNIPDLLDRADIYLSTSLFEGTSNSLMEAMNADLPIVATDVGDNAKLVLHGASGFLTEVCDVNTLSDYLEKLISSRELRVTFGKRAKELLEEKYSIDRFRERYRQLIEKSV